MGRKDADVATYGALSQIQILETEFNSSQLGCVLWSTTGSFVGGALDGAGKKARLCAANDHFTKTGSGQTSGKHSTRETGVFP